LGCASQNEYLKKSGDFTAPPQTNEQIKELTEDDVVGIENMSGK